MMNATDPAPVADDAALLDPAALNKLRWRCRRGLLENDLLIERFFSRGVPLTVWQGRGLLELMDLADNDLLDLLLGRTEPAGSGCSAEAVAVLYLMRPAGPARSPETTPEPSKEAA